MDGAESTAKVLNFDEAQVATVWKSVLGIQEIAPNSDFFELGGDSLQMIGMLFRIGELCGCEVTPDVLFEHPILRDFAASIKMLRTESVSDGFRHEGIV